jgi:flagellar biosynthesis protein FlhA
MPVLIVQPRARRPLAALLRVRAPGCAVLSINELPAAQPIEVISVVGGQSEAVPQLASDAGAELHEREPLAA